MAFDKISYRKQWAATHKEQRSAYMKEWKRTHPKKVDKNNRKAGLVRYYGLSLEEWDALLIAQSGRCAICNDPMQKPHVDHDHKTQKVRALACSRCNINRIGSNTIVTAKAVVRLLDPLPAIWQKIEEGAA